MDTLAVGINKLTLKAGDIVVVHMGPSWSPLTGDEINQLRAQLNPVLPAGVQSLILSGDISLTVMRDSMPVEPDVDAPAIVTIVGG